MARVLIVDDDASIRHSLSRLVVRLGHEADGAATLREGVEKALEGAFDVIFLDVRMPDGSGLEALPRIQEAASLPEVIIITGYGDPQGAELAVRIGAWDYIEKGSPVKEITLPLLRALQYRQEKKAGGGTAGVVALKREEIVGSSKRLRDCLDLVAQAAMSDANVLISGETGSGKELFARAIHSNSSRTKGNFVVVDCAALPETLVESVLFGHEKGAFTGAERARDGLVLQANGGTLFLDEIGELPFCMQKTFLRVLQERCFRPVGGNRELRSDFRLLAATNRNLDDAVQAGRFRSDLLFRLRSFSLELPPLRERPEDVKELARHFVDKYCRHYGLAPMGFSPEFLDALAVHHWPGNVRELANTLERAVASARYDSTLFCKHLPAPLRIEMVRASLRHDNTSTGPAVEAAASRRTQRFPNFRDFRETTCRRAEKQYLQGLIEAVGGEVREACRIADLSLSRMYALLDRHGIVKPR